jgi:hypothetical protein
MGEMQDLVDDPAEQGENRQARGKRDSAQSEVADLVGQPSTAGTQRRD